MINEEVNIILPQPHDRQLQFLKCDKKRIIVKAGRRGGKTVGLGILAVEKFLENKRVLYAAPTSDQLERFWSEVTNALSDGIDKKVFYKNESRHIICYYKNKNYVEQHESLTEFRDARIRAKTAWNADTLRGDFADYLILDEYQLTNEDTWQVVGAPMLLDNNGDAIFAFTPPSLHSRSVSKADDPRHALKLYRKAVEDTTGRWGAFHFTSHDNPHLSKEALADIVNDMTSLAIKQEILAEDIDEAPGALWKRENIDNTRVQIAPELDYVVIGVDPSVTSEGDECGIVISGRKKDNYYVLADMSLQGSPHLWATKAVEAYHTFEADKIIAESNQGGEMVSAVIHEVDKNVPVELVHASRGKATRAEPVAAIYEQCRAHHVGNLNKLEDEMCLWTPGDKSPNRMDALVWGMTHLINNAVKPAIRGENIIQTNIVYHNKHDEILEKVKRVRYG